MLLIKHIDMKSKKNIIIVLAIVIIAGLLLYYQQEVRAYLFKDEETAPEAGELNEALLRELSTVVTYAVPGGEDVVRFSVFVDDEDSIADVEAVDTQDPSHNANLNKFSKELIKVIKGKKLSELGPVDKVGTSSLTTAAFNEALPQLKAQL
jgi:hypothetical protein